MSDPHPRRSLRRLAGPLLLALAAAFLVPASSAAAAPAPLKAVDDWGFAYLDDPTPVPGYTMPTQRQWGSWKAAYPAEWATVWQLGTGFYRVRFPHIPGKGIAHVVAVNQSGAWCQVGSWFPSLDAEFVQVRCFQPGGAPVDSGFSLMYGENRASAGLYGWLNSAADGTVLNSHNSSGGVNVVGAGGPGTYKVWLPGLGSGMPVGNIQVTAVNMYRPVRCKVADWLPQIGGQLIAVRCDDQLGNPVSTEWTLTFHHKVNVFGESSPPKLWGYVWDTLGALPPGTNINTSGAVNGAVTVGPGLRMIILPKIGFDQSHVQVTAFGPDSSYCNLIAPWVVTAGGDVYVRDVACYANSGAPIVQRSLVTYTSVI